MAALLFIMFWLVIVAGMMILWIWTLIDCINN